MKYGLLLFSSLMILASCSSNAEYTRGIGVYPGDPDDYTGPQAVAGGDEYRNLALNRTARHSSSIDYNLTAQLAVDGIVSDTAPVLLEVFTSDGKLPEHQREILFDGNDKRMLTVNTGRGAFVRAEFGNLVIDCDKVTLEYDGGVLPVRNEEGKVFTADLSSVKGESVKLKLMHFYKDGNEISVLPSEYFTSCWMPAAAGNEWLYVDLGAVSSFDKIVLDWIGDTPSGSIEVSDDARVWDAICGIPASREIPVKGKGRYVRLSIDRSAGEQPCMLSEMEIYGNGGVTFIPAPEPEAEDGILRIQGGRWRLQRASQVSAAGEDLSVCGFDDSSWIIATVPGTVATSYFNAGAIPDIRYDDEQLQISESFFLSDFWYRDEFMVPESFAGKTLLLNFDGINWKADIWVNGKNTGKIEGAFVRGEYDVTDLIVPGKTNSIAVLIHRNAHPGAVREKTRYLTDNNGGVLGADNPTFHASIGWDWIPTVRGRNIGIWNDVYISAHSAGVSVENPYVSTDLPLPSVAYADLRPEVTLKNRSGSPVSGTVKFTVDSEVLLSMPVELAPDEVRDIRMAPVRMDNPELWWPAGYGEQHLYDAEISFEKNGTVSDAARFKLGIREMSYDDSDGCLDIYVNGRRLICNGGNWGFPEINVNYRAREYDIAAAYHADMGFTMIRNWVGQTGDEEFYEACDRHGVMIWQDFWLANPYDGPDPYYEDMFISNAADYVRRIRNHPSIALYCGRNEGLPPAGIDAALKGVVAEYHPEIHYIPHSAAGAVSGHGPYRALGPDAYFALKPGRYTFHSERGMPNVMTYEGMKRMLDEENRWPQNNVWGMHDYTLESAQSCATFNSFVEQAFGKPQDLKQFTKWAQWVNYDGYRAMFESRSTGRKGLLIWMSHSCWPSMVWQTYDYYFEPTAAYFGAKKGSAPIRIQYNPVSGQVEVVNNNAGLQTGLTARIVVADMFGNTLYETSDTIDSREDTTTPLQVLPLSQLQLTDVYFIRLSLERDGKPVAVNFYTRGKEYYNFKKLLELPAPELDVKFSYKLADGMYDCTAVVENRGGTPALMVRLEVIRKSDGEQILPVFYEDNYISLLPGEKRSVRIMFSSKDTGGARPELEYEVCL